MNTDISDELVNALRALPGKLEDVLAGPVTAPLEAKVIVNLMLQDRTIPLSAHNWGIRGDRWFRESPEQMTKVAGEIRKVIAGMTKVEGNTVHVIPVAGKGYLITALTEGGKTPFVVTVLFGGGYVHIDSSD